VKRFSFAEKITIRFKFIGYRVRSIWLIQIQQLRLFSVGKTPSLQNFFLTTLNLWSFTTVKM